MTMFSFHPVKHITTGEGGVIVTERDDFALKLKLFRSHGIVKTAEMTEEHGPGITRCRSWGITIALQIFNAL